MNRLSFKNQKEAFPLHYHPEFCISKIKSGVELINIGQKQFVGNVNDITITHPYELHSNPLYSSTNLLSFDTLYISDKTVRAMLPLGQTLHFKNRVIQNNELNVLFENLMHFDAVPIESLLKKFISYLSSFAELTTNLEIRKPLEYWNEIDTYIERNIKEIISLEQLADIANLNKYSFARKFKETTGMSPIHYTLMKKVFHCKKTITKKCSITEKAYEYNFTDTSHFSKSFKKFIGIRPKSYQKEFLT
ncbi:helix-turn-helix domain-containing protein [Aquimarina sp. W85]|uniref:helix-turn-helix domain-containing protein n=1 Tax=Aquimarina rhodophyticola TaxID=3342246 RepID=UPI00366E20C5